MHLGWEAQGACLCFVVLRGASIMGAEAPREAVVCVYMATMPAQPMANAETGAWLVTGKTSPETTTQ